MLTDLRRLAHLFTRRERRNAIILLMLMIIGAVLDVVGVGAIPAFVAMLSQPDRLLRYGPIRHAFEILHAQTAEERVLWAAIGLAITFVIKNSYLTAFQYMQGRYIYNRQVSVAGRMFRAYLHSPYTFHLQRNTADILHNTTNGAFAVVGELLVPTLRLIMELLVLTAVMALLISMEPLLSAGMVVIVGLTVALFMRSIRTKVASYGRDEHHCRSRMMLAVNQGLGGIKEVKVLGREAYFLQAFEREASGYSRAGRYRYIVYELPHFFLETLAVIVMMAATVFFLGQGRPIAAIVPSLTLLAVAALRLIPSANRIVNALIALRFGHTTLRALHEDVVNLEASARRGPASLLKEPFGFNSEIVFDRVTYAYPGAPHDALHNFTARIPKGSSVGVVGPSGAGKTTAVDILLGLLQPQHGCVRVDGKDIQGDLAGWQRLIGYIPQNIFLIDDTIRRNVALGIADEDVDEERVWAAIDAAQLRELVMSTAAQLDTIVGERGVRLSGGERQRIGIARALYHNPPVLVMDEATSALDMGTEREVVRALEQLRGKRTMVIIAHRLSTVVACDQLLLIKNGELMGVGSYEELRSSNSNFLAMTA